MSQGTLSANRFRVLENLNWSPDGLCLLVGANGSGKTTTLDLLRFLRNFFERGQENAFLSIDGGHIRTRGLAEGEPVELEFAIGEIRWQLRLPLSASGFTGTYGETLLRGDETVLHAEMFADHWLLGQTRIPREGQRCGAALYWDRHEPESKWMQPLASALKGTRVYKSFSLNKVQHPDNRDHPIQFLHGTGSNLWSVLNSWKSAPMMYGGQYEWVMKQARKAFPGLIGSIEFDRGIPYLFPPDSTDPADGLPPARAADGLLTGLLQLTAVAGAQRGALIAFDEIENQLHPHAIRMILGAMRERAEQQDLTIIITSHSPVVMNAFRREPDQFYVFEPGAAQMPVALTDLHDEDWLSAFMLGDLYDRLEFAAPSILHAGDA
jgi:predicted ATPase